MLDNSCSLTLWTLHCSAHYLFCAHNSSFLCSRVSNPRPFTLHKVDIVESAGSRAHQVQRVAHCAIVLLKEAH